MRVCAGDMDYQGSADEEEDDEATLDQEELLAARDGTHQVLKPWTVVSGPVANSTFEIDSAVMFPGKKAVSAGRPCSFDTFPSLQADQSAELAALNAEADMPLEQLLAMYEMVRQEKGEAGDLGRDSDDEDSLSVEQQPTVEG